MGNLGRAFFEARDCLRLPIQFVPGWIITPRAFYTLPVNRASVRPEASQAPP